MAVNLAVKVALCDIEGTTTSINFVKNILFPYSKDECLPFLTSNWNSNEVRANVEDLLNKIDKDSFVGRCQLPNEQMSKEEYIKAVTKIIHILIDEDKKIGPLKVLQGLIWEKGYKEGKLKGHVFDDVPDAFERFTYDGIKLYIYSSGSVKAQKLLFENSDAGDLLTYITGHFDTAIGAKQEQSSYEKIIKELGCKPREIVFFTDVPGEGYAASDAGITVVLLNRPGNVPLSEKDTCFFRVVNSFDDINLIVPI